MITATALPSILQDLAISDQLGKPAFSELRHASWIVNGYLLAYVVAMPLSGRLADVWGARRLFLGALVVFIVGSLIAGRGQTIDELIAGRIVQGIGGGVLVPVGTAAASHLFEGHARPRALGIIGALTFLGMAAGPFLGAAILGGFDVGSVGLAAALGAATLIGVADLGGPDPLVVGIGLVAVAIVATVLTVVRGLRHADPFLDPRLFRSAAFSSAALVSLLTGYGFATA